MDGSGGGVDLTGDMRDMCDMRDICAICDMCDMRDMWCVVPGASTKIVNQNKQTTTSAGKPVHKRFSKMPSLPAFPTDNKPNSPKKPRFQRTVNGKLNENDLRLEIGKDWEPERSWESPKT